MNMIKVQDKLPEPDKFVLTFGKEYGFVVGSVDECGDWTAKYTDYETGEPYLQTNGTVTHWMPLPEEPE